MKPTVHLATVEWRRGDAVFADHRYSRAHRWLFDGGAVVAASSSPHVVRAPLSRPENVDPEEAFVAALSSCHMLWFLDLAARDGWVVDAYVDEARGHMGVRDDGRVWVARVELSPRLRFVGEAPSEQALAALHHRAHQECYLASSVLTEVVIDA